MKNTFELLDNILRDKKDYQLMPCDDFNSWLIQKYISFHSPNYAYLVNELSNRWFLTLDDQQKFDLLKLILPKTGKTKIKWMAPKKEKKSSPTKLNEVANLLQISRRELQDMLEVCPDFLDEFADGEEKIFKKVEKAK